jgi:hypothetical protein
VIPGEALRRLTQAALVAVVGAACASSKSSSSPANPFSGPGTWTCPYTTNSGYHDTATIVFSMGDGGALVSTTTSLPPASCTLPWTVSGAKATVPANTTCGGFTITSFSFVATGDTATFSGAAVEHGTTPGPDGGPTQIDISGTFNGTCQDAAAIAAAKAIAAAEAGDGSFYGVDITGPSCPNGQLGFLQDSPPPNPSAACLQCFDTCQAKCQSMCTSYYKCICACDPHDGQCEPRCQAASSSYCQGCVQTGVDQGCFNAQCAGSPPVCCAASGHGCGTAPGYGCCHGTCTNGMCP